MTVTAGSAFGRHLRAWRARSGLSQLQLATEAGTTPRHLSFVETGRSRPGRDLVLRLARALDIPIRDQNALLEAAGLPPAFSELALDDAELAPVRRALERILSAHEPYPAWVMGRGLRFLRSNQAAERVMPGLCALDAEGVIDVWFGEGPYRQMIENWPEVVAWARLSLRRQVARSPRSDLQALLRRAEDHLKGVVLPEPTEIEGFPVVCPILRVHGRRVRTVSTVVQFETAVEVTSSELRVELVFPADDESDAFFRELAAGPGCASHGS